MRGRAGGGAVGARRCGVRSARAAAATRRARRHAPHKRVLDKAQPRNRRLARPRQHGARRHALHSLPPRRLVPQPAADLAVRVRQELGLQAEPHPRARRAGARKSASVARERAADRNSAGAQARGKSFAPMRHAGTRSPAAHATKHAMQWRHATQQAQVGTSETLHRCIHAAHDARTRRRGRAASALRRSACARGQLAARAVSCALCARRRTTAALRAARALPPRSSFSIDRFACSAACA